MSSMHATRLALLAAGLLTAGLAGCSLPQVLPLEGGTSAGPSPYGVWYEQHWATNSVLLAAADRPEEEIEISDDAAFEGSIEFEDDGQSDAQTAGEAAADAAEAAADSIEASADAAANASDFADRQVEEFDASSPYQFPSSSFAPPPATDDAAPSGHEAPLGDGPIRY